MRIYVRDKDSVKAFHTKLSSFTCQSASLQSAFAHRYFTYCRELIVRFITSPAKEQQMCQNLSQVFRLRRTFATRSPNFPQISANFG